MLTTPTTNEPDRCPETSPFLRLPCVLARGHEGAHNVGTASCARCGSVPAHYREHAGERLCDRCDAAHEGPAHCDACGSTPCRCCATCGGHGGADEKPCTACLGAGVRS